MKEQYEWTTEIEPNFDEPNQLLNNLMYVLKGLKQNLEERKEELERIKETNGSIRR